MSTCEEACKLRLFTSEVIIFSILVCYITVLAALLVFKHKVYGFTLKLILIIDLSVISFIIGYTLEITLYKQKTEQVTHFNETTLINWLIVIFYVGNVCGLFIYWIFAVKYWSIAVKIELAVDEQDINKRNKLISGLLFGGGVIIAVSTVFVSIKANQDFKHRSSSTWIDLFNYTILATWFCPFFLLMDSFRRLYRTQITNKAISVKMVLALALAFLLLIVGTFVLFLGSKIVELISFILVIVGFVFSTALLATILYFIGIASIESNDVADFSEILNEDWPE